MAQRQIDPKKVLDIYELFEAGATIAEIVEKLGTNRETVRQYLLKCYTPKQKRAIVLRNFRQRHTSQLASISLDISHSREVKA